jgi:hypothetical protein
MFTATVSRFVSLGFAAVLALTGCSESAPRTASKMAGDMAGYTAPVVGDVTAMRRITSEQYQNIVANVFGQRVKVIGKFDPLVRTNGLFAVGASKVNMTPSGFEQFEVAARAVAAQVVDPKNRSLTIPCTPADPKEFDQTCAGRFFAEAGRLLFRRPLTKEELKLRMDIAAAATKAAGDFYAGIESGLSSLLMTPAFIFVTDAVEPDPVKPDQQRLTAYSKASRLSFLLWNTTPDDALLTAAENGSLHTDKVLAQQVDRMLSSSQLQGGIRAFFSDMLGFEKFDTLEKDSILFPVYNAAVGLDAREQLLRMIVDELVTQNGDYRDLFTTRKTYISDALARIYRIPAPNPGAWGEYTFPENAPYAGIQSTFAFTALHSHVGRSSPTIRGKAIRELLLCQRVPDPPSNVDFSLFNAEHSEFKTARQRLEAHSTSPSCSGCHKLVDPIGLALENFDGAGQYRTTENGTPIDTSGKLDATSYSDANGLGKALSVHPAVTSCVVNRMYAYATGRGPLRTEKDWVKDLEKRFAAGGYRINVLLKAIATDPTFYAVPPASELKVTQNTP